MILLSAHLLQEQKRQRLREAGRRKLEEFKRRNVESLPAVPQLGTRSFSGTGLAPILGPPMAAMARGAAGQLNMAELSRALPGNRQARESSRSDAQGLSNAGRLLLRPAASVGGLPNTAAGAELANGNQNESAPVSRASSTNSAVLQGDALTVCDPRAPGTPSGLVVVLDWRAAVMSAYLEGMVGSKPEGNSKAVPLQGRPASVPRIGPFRRHLRRHARPTGQAMPCWVRPTGRQNMQVGSGRPMPTIRWS